jgi:glyoxylase-like metal-dependent hydrolase (beta-lactamase superfamily II)
VTPARARRADEAELLAVAADAGIHRIAVPTPFLVGPVNCYLIEDDPLTLVDTGPNSGTGLDTLEQGLAERGHRIEDLELIIVTHQHMDHLGLLEILVRRSGAEVAALDLLASWLENFQQSMADDDMYARWVMLSNGIPDPLLNVIELVGLALRAFGSSARVTRPLRDGDTLELRDRTLQAFHRPGHSPSDTIFWDADRRLLLAGDHLLGHISSNALVMRPLAGDRAPGGSRSRPLLAYIESMRNTRELPAELVLGGHGRPIVGHAELIDNRFRLHDRRARKLQRVLAGGPMNGFEIGTSLWGKAAVTQAFLTMSEVLGHLDLLIGDGTVRAVEDDEVVRYEVTGRPSTR